ncbi:hypothetical protein M514_20470 [Trichuris suis]|uniref:Uncharacterized protein n=1 Tax=Trichuris suis TaxID=68888 RepID=A0A085ND88_9BILA|nr:hypothetical protein M514_20470 [Trichuris suis]
MGCRWNQFLKSFLLNVELLTLKPKLDLSSAAEKWNQFLKCFLLNVELLTVKMRSVFKMLSPERCTADGEATSLEPCPTDSRNPLIQVTSLEHSLIAMYSASMVLNAVTVCFVLLQITGVPHKSTTYPVVLFLVSLQDAQSASA